MAADIFFKVLSKAVAGDKEALADVVELYMPLINRYSRINGVLDEDLRQYIFLHILKNISKFSL
ncbi:helix-turn-helix domain-containing protein [Acutalibacter sp. JLR.KK004]|uniref:helix-turn-helix domain-containing protein n=1 Tax=Acutalibacter sp. JLR.KK004 TaxID=3112622 RepID=UPI002FF2BEA7